MYFPDAYFEGLVGDKLDILQFHTGFVLREMSDLKGLLLLMKPELAFPKFETDRTGAFQKR